jgi:hypothetical protein
MSTQLRRLAQAPAHSPARTKFFINVAALSGTGAAGDSIVSLNPATTIPAQAVVAEDDFTTIFDAGTAYSTVGTLFRDLGRSVTVVDAENNHLYRYRQVQRVNGISSEGVHGDATITAPNPWTSNLYVLVWSASGSGVNVARTG